MKLFFYKNVKGATKLVAIFSFVMMILFSSCGKSHQCIGTWEGSVGNSQFIKLEVNSNGEYSLKIIQKRERYDACYNGQWKKISDNIIALNSDAYRRDPNENRRAGDPQVTIVNVNTTFYLQTDGAFSQSESGLTYTDGKPSSIKDPICYLYKTSKEE